MQTERGKSQGFSFGGSQAVNVRVERVRLGAGVWRCYVFAMTTLVVIRVVSNSVVQVATPIMR